MNNAFRTLLFSTVLLSSTAFAQSSDIGQVDLKPIGEAIGVTPKLNLNFGPAMMKGFAESFRGSNAELAGIIDSISGLRLMVFEDVDTSGALVHAEAVECVDQHLFDVVGVEHRRHVVAPHREPYHVAVAREDDRRAGLGFEPVDHRGRFRPLLAHPVDRSFDLRFRPR